MDDIYESYGIEKDTAEIPAGRSTVGERETAVEEVFNRVTEESREMFGNDLWIFPSKSRPDFRGPEKRAMSGTMPEDLFRSIPRLYPFLDRKLGPSGTYGISLFSLAASLFSLSLYR